MLAQLKPSPDPASPVSEPQDGLDRLYSQKSVYQIYALLWRAPARNLPALPSGFECKVELSDPNKS